MIVKTVKLVNFRSHKVYQLDCRKATSLIVGENGSGKTSVLEAIYIALRGKSFKAVDREIVQRGQDFYRIELEYSNSEKVKVVYDGVVKKYEVSGQKFKRLPKKHHYPIVLFEPDDLNLVTSGPSRRRTYLDRFLGQVLESYHNSLLKYEKALKQRNELLKQDYLKRNELFSWNILLAQYGCEIYRMRKALILEIDKKITKRYQMIAKNQDRAGILYVSTATDNESEYLKNLEESFERDRMTKCTNFGVHRDDIEFIFNDVLADGSASRGEVRSMIIALKFIEAAMIEEKLKKKPLILLDDVFSELDEERQKCLVNNFKDNQIIMTSVREI